jgi:hypothetical protein
MFRTFALFELRYQLRNPVFWAATILFFLLTLSATSVESVRMGSGGSIHTNAPTAIVQILVIMSMYFMFVTTAFVGNVVVRDDETGFGSIIRSTPINKYAYMFGRFTGAFMGAAIAFLAVPLAVWIGTWMPWVDPDHLGPHSFYDYMFAYLFMALPNLLITSAIFFSVAAWTRSVTYSYLSVIIFMVAYFALTAALKKSPDLAIAALFDPFGSIAFTLGTRYLTPIQSNTFSLELTGILAVHRLIWVGLSLLIVASSVYFFNFAARGLPARHAKRQAARDRKLGAGSPRLVERLPQAMPQRAGWSMLLARTRLEMRLVFKSPAFWVLALVGALNLFYLLYLAGRFYGAPPWPRPFVLIDVVQSNSNIITLLIATYFAGEVVWRERDRRFNEIFDATPLPNWIFLLSKLAGVLGVLVVLGVAVVLAEAILFQWMRGLTDIGFGQWLSWFVAPSLFYVVQIAVLAVVAQAVSPNKFVGWAIMLLYIVSTMVLSGMGFDHPLFHYADVANPLSDMNGSDFGGALAWWMRSLWMVCALLLGIIGHLMWRRGTAVTLGGQWRTLPRRLRGWPLGVFGTAAVVAAAMAGFIIYSTYVLNAYQSQTDQERLLAAYEKRYARYVGLPQPTLTDVFLTVDVRPRTHFARFDGRYQFVNRTTAAIPTLHVRMLPGTLPLRELSVAGATLIHRDDANSYRIYRFNRPLQSGDSGTLTFRTQVARRGLAVVPVNQGAWETAAQPAMNGAYLTNQQFAPVLGMSTRGFLSGRRLRNKYGLGLDVPTPKLEEREAQKQNYAGMTRVNTDITVSTDADQILVATGTKVAENVSAGRRIARFVSPKASLDFITIQSARYAVKSVDAGGIKVSVYYEPKHPWNVDRMLSVMRESLNYYQKNFGPYPYDYARIIERPGYGGGANSAPGTIGYSENVGFTMDLRDRENVDFLSYVTAHELAHQYWFHQLMPANMEGAEVLTESLSQYSALMVLKRRMGAEQIRALNKYELDLYLSGRRSEATEERPLARTKQQGYIHYQKGALVMYLIQDRLGEDRVNGVLRGILAKYGSKGSPYPRSTDLVEGLLGIARTPEERELVHDLFNRITLYDLAAKQALVRRIPDGRYETVLTVRAGKSYADGNGNERVARFDTPVDVGLFTASPGARGFAATDMLAMRRVSIGSGTHVIRFVTRKKPAYAGIDPYITFIDRNLSDNVIPTVER